MTENNRVIIANITWNNSGWRNIYVNPKAGHEYARKHPGHESLNFEFNKRGLDNEQNVHGFIQWTAAPTILSNDAIIIFYSKNLETNEGEIVGIYGDAKILDEYKTTKWNGFENNELLSNIVAKKEISLLFPIPLKSSKYSEGKRLVPQVGYTYKSIEFAEKIIVDEIKELQKAGIRLDEYEKLRKIYRFIAGHEYTSEVADTDLKEQEELLPLIKTALNREQIIKELQEIKPQNPELVEFKGKQYKRDNKSIVELKILRNFKCQICGFTILKKDNSHYIEAAHITEKRHKGPETPDNILILCPNHHKEFDLGNKKIIERTTENIVFDLNGKRYEIDLTLN
jgi:putative restriction endonuclease